MSAAVSGRIVKAAAIRQPSHTTAGTAESVCRRRHPNQRVLRHSAATVEPQGSLQDEPLFARWQQPKWAA
ncbi:MAG: hypothetical protein VKO39_13395 [Cyanobacteriota bacterium]|nr:hypothetical protein [Cyanobacteriota bacterium]